MSILIEHELDMSSNVICLHFILFFGCKSPGAVACTETFQIETNSILLTLAHEKLIMEKTQNSPK